MMSIIRARNLFLIAVCSAIVCSCGRDFARMERPQFVEEVTGGTLCDSARVSVLNKSELAQNPWRSNLRILISANPRCASAFSRSLFGENELHRCRLGSRYACTKQGGSQSVSLFWLSAETVVINTW